MSETGEGSFQQHLEEPKTPSKNSGDQGTLKQFHNTRDRFRQMWLGAQRHNSGLEGPAPSLSSTPTGEISSTIASTNNAKGDQIPFQKPTTDPSEILREVLAQQPERPESDSKLKSLGTNLPTEVPPLTTTSTGIGSSTLDSGQEPEQRVVQLLSGSAVEPDSPGFTPGILLRSPTGEIATREIATREIATGEIPAIGEIIATRRQPANLRPFTLSALIDTISEYVPMKKKLGDGVSPRKSEEGTTGSLAVSGPKVIADLLPEAMSSEEMSGGEQQSGALKKERGSKGKEPEYMGVITTQHRGRSDISGPKDKSGTSSPTGDLSPGSRSRASSHVSLDQRSVVSDEDFQARRRRFKEILSLDDLDGTRIDGIKEAIKEDFEFSVEKMNFSGFEDCCDAVEEELKKLAPDCKTFNIVYDRIGMKNDVINTFLSLEKANPWDRDPNSTKAISDGMKDENVLNFIIKLGEEFGSFSFESIIDEIRKRGHIKTEIEEKMDKHMQEQSERSEKSEQEEKSGKEGKEDKIIADILKSEREIDLEGRLKTLGKRLEILEKVKKQYDDTGKYDDNIGKYELHSQSLTTDGTTLWKDLEFNRGQSATGKIRTVMGVLNFAEAFLDVMTGTKNVSDAESGIKEAGDVIQNAQKAFGGLKEALEGAKEIYDGKRVTSRENKKINNFFKRHLNVLRRLRRNERTKPENAKDIQDIIMQKPFGSLENTDDHIYASEIAKQAKEDPAKVGEKLQELIEEVQDMIKEVQDNLKIQRKISDAVNKLTFVLVKAMTVKLQTAYGEYAGRIVDIPDKRMAGYWRKMRDIVDSLVEGHLSAEDDDTDKLFGVLLGEMMSRELPKWSISKGAMEMRQWWHVVCNFSSHRKNNTIEDAEGRLTMLNAPRARRRSLRKQFGKIVYRSRLNTEDSSEDDTKNISDARANELMRKTMRNYRISDPNMQKQMEISDKICAEEMKAKYVTLNFITQTCVRILADMIVTASAQEVADNYSKETRRHLEENPDDIKTIVESTRREAMLNNFISRITMINRERIHGVLNSNSAQEAEKEITNIQSNIDKWYKKYPPASGDTYLSEFGEVLQEILKTGISAAAVAGLSW